MKEKYLVLPEFSKNITTGGPPAVAQKMFLSDNDKIFSYLPIEACSNKKAGFEEIFRKILLSGNSLFASIFLFLSLLNKKRKIRNMGKGFHGFISRSVGYSYIVKKLFPHKKLIHVCHGQGNLCHEYTDLLGVSKGKILQKYINKIEVFVYSRADKIGFPSQGAHDALVNSAPYLNNVIQNKGFSIFYNGIEIENIVKETMFKNEFIDDGYNFITVSSLNTAKGVDRIPDFLSSLQKAGIKYKWILVGSGKLKDVVYKKIKKFHLEDSFFHIQEKISRKEVLSLLRKSDFYILFHRFSIFDLATLEAMSQECIPVLSNVGGNKEVILDNNGLLMDNFSDAQKFISLVKGNDLDKMKKRNKEIVKTEFSLQKFFSRYKSLV